MEGGKPKPALPEDVARLEARAKVNPALRPPSKPPAKATAPVSSIARMVWVRDGKIDFSIYYDCQEAHNEESGEVFYDCREPPEARHPISDTGDLSPTVRTSPCRHMWRSMRTMHVPLLQSIDMRIGCVVHCAELLMQRLLTPQHVASRVRKDTITW